MASWNSTVITPCRYGGVNIFILTFWKNEHHSSYSRIQSLIFLLGNQQVYFSYSLWVKHLPRNLTKLIESLHKIIICNFEEVYHLFPLNCQVELLSFKINFFYFWPTIEKTKISVTEYANHPTPPPSTTTQPSKIPVLLCTSSFLNEGT